MLDNTHTDPREAARAAALDPTLANHIAAARILGISKQRVSQLRQKGKLTVVADFGSFGMFFRRADVEERRDRLRATRAARSEFL